MLISMHEIGRMTVQRRTEIRYWYFSVQKMLNLGLPVCKHGEPIFRRVKVGMQPPKTVIKKNMVL